MNLPLFSRPLQNKSVFKCRPTFGIELGSRYIVWIKSVEIPPTSRVKDQTLDYQVATFQFMAFSLGFSPTIDRFRKT